jgi:hypothetical protein
MHSRESKPVSFGGRTMAQSVKKRISVKKQVDERLSELAAREADADPQYQMLMKQNFGAVAASALTIDEEDHCLREAFRRSRLNPANPMHWKMLLSAVTDVAFSPGAKRGRKKYWRPETWSQLLRRYQEEHAKDPSQSTKETCEKLTECEEYKLRNVSAATLQRNLQRAAAAQDAPAAGDRSTFALRSFLPVKILREGERPPGQDTTRPLTLQEIKIKILLDSFAN